MISEQTPEKLLRQFSSHIMMVRPVRFAYNTQTAEDNAFMHKVKSLDSAEIQTKALAEFEMFVAKLKDVGIRLTIFDDRPEPHTPDSIFPNNWISFHQNEKIIIYPIKAENRRLEKRKDIVETLSKLYPNPEVIDWSEFEEKELFLEGTGSLVLDRYHEIAYACISQRTHQEVLDAFCQLTGYKPVAVHGFDQDGEEIYHTNVMMAMGENFVVVCLGCIWDQKERAMLENKFRETGKEIVNISLDQMNAFAGNMLQVKNKDGKLILVMSSTAYESLTPDQITLLEGHTSLLHCPIDTIETYGGGSARCMMAEVFLPKL